MSRDGDAKIEAKNVSLHFGGVLALQNVTLEVRQGEVLAIVGPNGAGKTCILNCMNGFYRPSEGRILFEGRDITHMPSHKIARLGVARTFQNPGLYNGLTVLENIMAGRQHHMKYGTLSACWYFGRAHRVEMENRQIAEEIIDFLEIEAIRKDTVGTLAYGLRKRVELGKALAMEPTVLLLDEPMAGMNTEEKEDMARFILDINEEKGTAIVLIEHDMGVVMDISDRVIVLESGSKIAEGRPDDVQRNPEVIRAYLGEADRDAAARR